MMNVFIPLMNEIPEIKYTLTSNVQLTDMPTISMVASAPDI